MKPLSLWREAFFEELITLNGEKIEVELFLKVLLMENKNKSERKNVGR